MIEQHGQKTDRFEALLAELLAIGKDARAQKLLQTPELDESLTTLRSKASLVVDGLIQCCREMERDDDRRRFFAMALIVAAGGSDLLGLHLPDALDKILPK